jgi:hypothetical protein
MTNGLFTIKSRRVAKAATLRYPLDGSFDVIASELDPPAEKVNDRLAAGMIF